MKIVTNILRLNPIKSIAIEYDNKAQSAHKIMQLHVFHYESLNHYA